MPLPKPEPDEEHDDFIDRCMGDDQTNEDFPDPGQRRAVCETQWEEGQEGATAMKYPRILQAITSTPWAILPENLEMIIAIFSAAARGEGLTAQEVQARIGAAQRPAARRDGAIAVLPLHGLIAKRMNLMTQVSGGTSTEVFGNTFRTAVAEPGIKAIVIDVDSPGGNVAGIDELATEIFKARGTKPIVAVADTIMASAAYYIAAAADEIVATPSGFIGAIGTVMPHIDVSGVEEKAGITTTLISAGKFKTEANQFEPLSDDARASLQVIVDDAFDMFVRSVARSRGVSTSAVRNGFGEGRLVSAKTAVELGMADRTGTLRETLKRLGASEAALMGSTTTINNPSPEEAETFAREIDDRLRLQMKGTTDKGPTIDTRKRRLRLLEKA
jgi:signal peptide peptidase SppA